MSKNDDPSMVANAGYRDVQLYCPGLTLKEYTTFLENAPVASQEVADLLSLTPHSIRILLANGRLRKVMVTPRVVRVALSDVNKCLQKQTCCSPNFDDSS